MSTPLITKDRYEDSCEVDTLGRIVTLVTWDKSGKVVYLSLTPEMAREIARNLVKKSGEAEAFSIT